MNVNYDEQFLMALAYGEKEAMDELAKMPTTVKMGIALTVDEIRKQKGIVPQTTGYKVFAEQPVRDYDAEIAETIRKSLEAKRQAEEERQKRHEEYVKKQVESAIQRSRLGLPSQPALLRSLSKKG